MQENNQRWGVGAGCWGSGVEWEWVYWEGGWGGINTIKNEGWTFEGKALQSCRLNKEMVQR